MSDELQRILDAERAAPPQPPVGSASAGWQRLQRSIVAAAPAPFDLPPPGVETLAVAKTGAGLGLVGKVLATTVIVGATTTAVVVARPEPTPAPTVARAVHEDAPRPRARPPAARAPTSAAIPPAVVDPGGEVPPAPAPVPEPLPAERVRKPKSATVPTPPPIVDASALEREAALVAASQRALAQNRPERALDLLEQHARTFPHGGMAEDRDALRVVALCAAGRTDDAATQRTKFFRRWPKSLHASRVRAACDG